MKTLLITFLLSLPILCEAQSIAVKDCQKCGGLKYSGKVKKPRYYETGVKYYASDGCWHTNTVYTENVNGEYGWDEIYSVITKYAKPYKVYHFEITGMVRSTHKMYVTHKNEKFSSCKPTGIDTSPIWSSPGTDSISFLPVSHAYFSFSDQNYIWVKSDTALLHITGIDSTGTTTVTFARSKVKFLNDSTFTFKMKFK